MNATNTTTQCTQKTKNAPPLIYSLNLIGQQAIAAGWKKITMKDMRDFFCCDAITQKEADKTLARIKANPLTQANVSPKHYRDVVHMRPRQCYIIQTTNISNKWIRHYYKRCEVVMTDLAAYINDTIPERCLVNVAKARAIGIQTFKVAYPAMVGTEDVIKSWEVAAEETKIFNLPEQSTSEYDDPIIIGVLDDNNWIEIDRWE